MIYFKQNDNLASLRGGGCGVSKHVSDPEFLQKKQVELQEDFSDQLKSHTETICQAATLVNDQSHQSEVMISIQWFVCMEEQFVLLSCNAKLVTRFFDLIKECFTNLLSVANIYMRAAGTICLHILRILSQLSKVIFFFYLQNNNSKRFMKEDEKQDLLSTILDLEGLVEIEASNIWATGIEFEIQILKSCIKNLPSDSKQGQDLLFTFLGSAANSVLSMSLDDKLIDTLIEGAQFLFDKYQTHNLKQLYQLFYSLDIIKWVILSQLAECVSVSKILYKLQLSFKKYVANSTDWMVHYCWIKLIGDLLQYRPIVLKDNLLKVDQNAKQTWNKLVEKKLLIPLAFNKLNYARISINTLENIGQVQRLFHGVEELKKFQGFLINSKNYEFNIFSTYLTQRKSVNPEILSQYRNFLFQDKSVDYIQQFSGLAQSQLTAILTNIPALILKLKDYPQLLDKEKDSTMIDLQVDYYKESLQTFMCQFQSIIFMLIFSNQFIDYFFKKQSLIVEELEKVSNVSEKETKTIVQVKESYQKLKSDPKVLENLLNQLFLVTQKLKNIEHFLLDVNQSQMPLSDDIKKSFRELDQMPNNQTLQNALEEMQKLSQQSSSEQVELQNYQNTIYQLSNSLSMAVFSQINFVNLEVNLAIKFQCCLSNFNFFNTQLAQLENQFIQLQSSDTLTITKSDFTFSHMILSLGSDLFLVQMEFWDRFGEYYKILNNNQGQVCEKNELLKKIKGDFLPLINQSIQLFSGLSTSTEMQVTLKSQTSQTSDQQFENIKLKIIELKSLTTQEEEFTSILQDINCVNKIISKSQFLKIELQIEYLEILNSIKLKYTEEKYNQPESQKQNDQPSKNVSEEIRKINSELHELCHTGKQLQEIVSGSQQTILETKQDQINGQIVQKLKNVIFLKIKQFIDRLQEHQMSQKSFQDQLNKFQSSITIQSQAIQENQKIEHLEQMQTFQEKQFIEEARLVFSKVKHIDELNEKSFFGEIFQQVKDKWNNQGYKLREAIAVSCIFISSNIPENQIQNYCQDMLVKIWASERDERVKKILKNKDLLVLQTKLFSSDLKNANEKLKEEIQFRFQELERIEQELKQEGDPQKRERLQQQLREEFQQFEEYVDNMNDMNSELKLQIEYLKTITKQLKKMEEKIDQLQNTMNDVQIDIKFLRGKKFDQLLQIRKQQILQNKHQIDLQSVYVNLRTIEKDVLKGGYLSESVFFVEDASNEEGEVNEFLWAQKDSNKEVMLIHGCAGSGKSTAARKIEEFLWAIFDQPLRKGRNIKLLPIYVSLPTIKEPEQNVVEQALESESYHFDSIQLREFKEAVGNNQFRLILILDSYDEIKSKFISKNLYKSNRLKEVWNNPQVIFTTRTEILTSHHYPEWFQGNELSGLKEIEIQKFNETQRDSYLQQFCQMSVKKSLIGLYKYYLEIENKKMHDLDQFILIWKPIQNYLQQVSPSNKLYLDNSDVIAIIKILKKNDFVKRINEEQIINFQKELENLWGKSKFDDTIQNIQIENLLETPFMMEIVVQVLPIMTKKYTDYIQQKEVFIENFSKIKEQLRVENKLIISYKQQNGLQTEIQTIQNNESFNEQAALIWEYLETNQFFTHFSIANRLSRAQFDGFKLDIIDLDIIISALESHNLTQYDFYQSFVEFYHNSQIQKLRNQSKSINYESFLLDLNEFSMKLALEMTKNQLTQVSYKFTGQLKFQTNKNLQQRQWEDDFFNDLELGGDYKKLIRSAVLLGQKGSIYFFVHKSIQEFLIGKYMYELLKRANLLNLQLLKTCMQLAQQISIDSSFVNFLQEHFTFIIQELSRKSGIENDADTAIQLERELTEIITFLTQLVDDYANQINLSKEEFFGSLRYFKEKLNFDPQIRQLILLTCKLSGIDCRYIKFSSNLFFLLTNMLEYLGEQDFRNVVLQDTSIAGASFHGSDFSGSVMKNVNISGINLNNAVLANVEWNNLKINELPSSLGHTDSITGIDFSLNGSQIVSSSIDKVIKLWDANSGSNLKDFIGHSSWVLSVAFSPDSSMIASCGCDKSIIIWSVESGQMEKKLLGHNGTVKKVLFTLDGANVLSGGDDQKLYLWDLDNEDISKTYSGHTDTINSFAFNQNGKLIVSCSQDQSIIIWDKETQVSKQKIRMHAYSVSFSSDSQRIVSGGQNQIVYIWDANTGQEISKIIGHTNTVLAVCYSKDGTRIATGSSDKTIRLWDAKNTKEIQRFEGHLGFVNQVIFSPNGQKLVSGSKDNTIRQWDITVSKETIRQQGHVGPVNAIQFTPDGRKLVSAGLADQIQLWDAHTGRLQMKIKNSYNEPLFSISPNGELIASRNKTNLMIRQLKTGEIAKQDSKSQGLITSIVFSFDGKQIASSNINNSLTLWDVKTLEQVDTKECDEFKPNQSAISRKGDLVATVFKKGKVDLWGINRPTPWNSTYRCQTTSITPQEGNEDDILSIAFSPDDQMLVLGQQDSSINLWSFNEIKRIRERKIDVHKDGVTQVTFTLDGKHIISTSNDYTISIYDIQKREQVYKLQCHQSEVLSLALSLDGQRFAAGSWDKTISLWKFQNSSNSIRDQIYDFPVYFLEEKKILVTGGYDNKVRLWNFNTNQELKKFVGHQQKIIAVTITQDSQKVAASNINNLVIIWNTQNCQEIWRIKEEKQLNSLISFSPNGKWLAIGGIGDFISIYDIEQKQRVYCNFIKPMVYLQVLSFLKDGWEISSQAENTLIVNIRTRRTIQMDKQNFNQGLQVSCYKVISEYLTSLKSENACIFNSNIKSQLGFDIQILLKQRGGNSLDLRLIE